MHKSLFDNINIILCDTSNSGNIGTSARAMKTMGLYNLTLVAPKAPIDDYCIALSTNASDVVNNCTIVDDLDQAIVDKTLVFAMTARKREFNYFLQTPFEAVPEILTSVTAGNKVAIVFGCEKSGLTIEQLEKCNRMITIPGNIEFSSLNLSHAVQIIAYEIYRQSNGNIDHLKKIKTKKKATIGDNLGIIDHVEKILTKTNYFSNKNQQLVIRRLQHIINKADLNQNEVKLLRGMLSKFNHG